MDIYGAEIQVNKLLNYVKSLSDSKPRMYQKSRDRLKELANTCNQVVVVISEILQNEALMNNDTEEFEGSDNTDFNTVLNSMENQISELRQFLSAPKSSATIPEPSSSVTKKKALYSYKQCLLNLSNSSCIVVEAEDCSKMLWSWFSSRFLEGPDNFRYNMKRLPGWIRDIVIVYCYHLESDTLDDFKFRFQNWIDHIGENSNYAVPYEIYQFDKQPDPNLVTLTSAVMWDILLDSGLRSLCADTSSGLYPSEDCVYSLVGSLNSDVMNPYTNYLYDNSILQRCNLTLKEGGK